MKSAYKHKQSIDKGTSYNPRKCAPCGVALYLFMIAQIFRYANFCLGDVWI